MTGWLDDGMGASPTLLITLVNVEVVLNLNNDAIHMQGCVANVCSIKRAHDRDMIGKRDKQIFRKQYYEYVCWALEGLHADIDR